jgi:hypothetical protein
MKRGFVSSVKCADLLINPVGKQVMSTQYLKEKQMSDQVKTPVDQKPATDVKTNSPEKDKAVAIDSGTPKTVEPVKAAETDKESKQA